MEYNAIHKGKVRCTGTNDECWVYILKHQPQSVAWATRCGGWSICPTITHNS